LNQLHKRLISKASQLNLISTHFFFVSIITSIHNFSDEWDHFSSAQYTSPTRQTVELSRVGGVYGILNQLATVSTSLNKLANTEVELRLVGGANAPVGSCDPVYNFLCW